MHNLKHKSENRKSIFYNYTFLCQYLHHVLEFGYTAIIPVGVELRARWGLLVLFHERRFMSHTFIANFLSKIQPLWTFIFENQNPIILIEQLHIVYDNIGTTLSIALSKTDPIQHPINIDIFLFYFYFYIQFH